MPSFQSVTLKYINIQTFMYMNFSKGVNKFNFHNDIAFNHYIDTVADMQSNFLSKSAVMRVAFLHQGQ